MRQQTDAIDAARVAGVRQVVKVSVQDASPTAGLARGWHGQIEEHLKRSGVPWAVLRPNSYMQYFLADAADIADGGQFFGAYRDGAIAHVDCRDAAGCAAALLTRPIGDEQTFVLTGPEGLTQEDIAARFTVAPGRHIRYVDLTPEAMASRLINRYGLPASLATEAVETMTYLASGAWGAPTTAIADLTGRNHARSRTSSPTISTRSARNTTHRLPNRCGRGTPIRRRVMSGPWAEQITAAFARIAVRSPHPADQPSCHPHDRRT